MSVILPQPRPGSFHIDETHLSAFKRIEEVLGSAQNLVLCAHTKPDGDALGSVLGLAGILRHRFPENNIICLLADDEAPSRTFSFLNIDTAMVQPSRYLNNMAGDSSAKNPDTSPSHLFPPPDVFIALDTPLLKRLGHAAKVARCAREIVSFDHHVSSDPFANVALVDDKAPATGSLIAEFGLFLEEEMGKEMVDEHVAQCLFMAVMTDTGRFQYQNTTAECLAQAAWLVERGANPAYLSSHIYQNEPLSILRLRALVTERIKLFCDGNLATSHATLQDFADLNVRTTDADGLVDVVRSVEGSHIALFLKEVDDGSVFRGNLRAKGDYDVASIAEAFGGGGHKAAAGFSAKGTIEEIEAKVISLIEPLF